MVEFRSQNKLTMSQQKNNFKTSKLFSSDTKVNELQDDVCDLLHDATNLVIELFHAEELAKCLVQVLLQACHVALV